MPGSRLKTSIIPELVETTKHTSGYHDKLQDDEVPEGSAVRGSQNFVLGNDGKWTTRGGSKYLGTRSSDTGGCTSSLKLLRRDSVELPVIFYSTKSKYLHPSTLDWAILETGLTSGLIWGGDMGEKSADNMNYLVMGNGTDNYRYWSGATALVSSTTINTIVVQGSTTLANLGFTATGSLSLNGNPYAYTGLSGQTFTGVTPDPSSETSGTPLTQLPVSSGSLPKGNVITSYGGRIVMFASPGAVALTGGGSILGSVLNDYTTFAFSAPRVAAEGYQIVMNEGGGSGTALVPFEGGIMCAKENAVSFHQVTFDENDAPSIRPLLPYDRMLTGHNGNVGVKTAISLRNQIFFISPRKVINSLQRILQVDYPQSLPFSDRIQNTCDDMTWDSESCAAGFNYIVLFSGKAASTDSSPNKQLLYDQRFDCWWTPAIGQSISSYFVYGGKLHGTLADSPDVIELFNGTTDFATTTTNGNAIDAKLVMNRRNFGSHSKRKKTQREYVEGWMSKAGTVTISISFDENGGTLSGTLSGTEDGYFFEVDTGGTFGLDEFGVETFGGSWIESSTLPAGVGHFRILLNYIPKTHWNSQISFETSNYFKLLVNAPDPRISDVGFPSTLKKALA